MVERLIGVIAVLIISLMCALVIEIKGAKEIKKLHEELKSVFPYFDFYEITDDMKNHTKRVLLKNDIERLKLCALCHLCRERELQDKEQTIQEQKEEN